MSVLHDNENYEVITLDDKSADNYGVRNKETDKVEYTHKFLPQVMGICEQFNFLLINQIWKEEVVEAVSAEPRQAH